MRWCFTTWSRILPLRLKTFAGRVLRGGGKLSTRSRDGRARDYPIFIMRTACNHIGLNVKLADLLENCDLSRIPDPGPEDFEGSKSTRTPSGPSGSSFLARPSAG